MKRSSVAITLVALGQLSCGGSSPSAPTTTTTLPTAATPVISGVTTLSEATPTAQLRLIAGTQDLTGVAAWQSSNTSVATIASGLVRAVAPGVVTITAQYQQQANVSATMSVAQDSDCLAYAASGVAIQEDTSFTPPAWNITAPYGAFGFVYIGLGDTLTDANNLLALFQRYQQFCFIGRSNSRANRQQYLVTYFTGSSGQQTTIAPEDCVAYSAGALQVVSQGPNGFAVMSGATRLAMLDTQLEANLAMAVASRYSSECYIGRGNTRPNPYEFIMEYWK